MRIRGRPANRKALVVADASAILLRAAQGGAFAAIDADVRSGKLWDSRVVGERIAARCSEILGRAVVPRDLPVLGSCGKLWDAVFRDDDA